MAKKKKSNQGAMAMEMPREKRVNVGVEEAENGFIVHASCEGGKTPGYQSKNYIATNHADATRIANTHIQQSLGGKKARGKKAKRKAVATKR